MMLKKLLTLAGAALATTLLLTACSSADSAKQVKIGVMSMTESDEARWEAIEKEVKKIDPDIKLDFVQFGEYSQPNPALADGDTDINAFQHHKFLEDWNKDTGNDIKPILDTYLSPIRLYSGIENKKNRYASVEELPEGATIAIPNDSSNSSRSLYVLQSVGLIELSVSGGKPATVADIKANPKSIKIKEVDADKLPDALQDVDAAVINNSFAAEAKLDTDKALYVEKKDAASAQWINVIAAPKDWKDKKNAKAIQAVLDAYHTDSVKKTIEDTAGGLDLPVW